MLFDLSDYPTLVVGDVVSFTYNGKIRDGEVVLNAVGGRYATDPYLTVKLSDGSFRSFTWKKIEGLAIA